MDPHTLLIRRRAERVALAVVASRRALRAAVSTATSGEVPKVPVPAPDLVALLRAAVPPGADKPTRKAHAELVAAMELAALRLLTIGNNGPADNQARAAVRLLARLCTRWDAQQDQLSARQQAFSDRLRRRVSERKLLVQKSMGSHFVLAPAARDTSQAAPALSPITIAANKHWRHRSRIEQAALDIRLARLDRMTPFPAGGSDAERAQRNRAARLATYTPAEHAAAAAFAALPPAGAAAPAVLPLPLLPTTPKETTRSCPTPATSSSPRRITK